MAGRRTADYATLGGEQAVHCIIEVKLHLGDRKDWTGSPEFVQAREYARMSRAQAFALMDCERILCFRRGDAQPRLTLYRNSLDEAGLRALRAHILGEKLGDASNRLDR